MARAKKTTKARPTANTRDAHEIAPSRATISAEPSSAAAREGKAEILLEVGDLGRGKHVRLRLDAMQAHRWGLALIRAAAHSATMAGRERDYDDDELVAALQAIGRGLPSAATDSEHEAALRAHGFVGGYLFGRGHSIVEHERRGRLLFVSIDDVMPIAWEGVDPIRVAHAVAQARELGKPIAERTNDGQRWQIVTDAGHRIVVWRMPDELAATSLAMHASADLPASWHGPFDGLLRFYTDIAQDCEAIHKIACLRPGQSCELGRGGLVVSRPAAQPDPREHPITTKEKSNAKTAP